MSDLNSSILKLARNIRAGKIGVEKTKEIINQLEAKYGDWDMPVELPEGSGMSSEQYLDTLADTINCGAFSKEALIRMATLSETLYSNKRSFRYLKPLVVVLLIVLVIVIVVVAIGGT